MTKFLAAVFKTEQTTSNFSVFTEDSRRYDAIVMDRKIRRNIKEKYQKSRIYVFHTFYPRIWFKLIVEYILEYL